MERTWALVAFPQHQWPFFSVAVVSVQSLSPQTKTLRGVTDYLKTIL